MRRRIDRDSPLPLYEQIAHAIRWMIATGEIAAGSELEPTRSAATTWGVNRHTVAQAYRRLVRWGLVESRPPNRFTIRAQAAAPTREGRPGPEIDTFVDEFVRIATERFDVDRNTLADLVAGRRDGRAAAPTVVVVECNATQVEDHAAEIVTRWHVRALPFVLRDSDLPDGPVVCTYFHFEELRQRWPHRIHDVRFMAVHAAGDLMAAAIQAARDGGAIAVVADESEAEARNLSADLQDLFPPEKFTHHLEVRPEWQANGTPVERVTLVGPRAFERLSAAERALAGVFPIRYRIDETDLAGMGEHFGWTARQAAAY